EHALHFRRLIGAAHPPFNARISPSARRDSGHQRGKVAGSETDHWIVRIERGNDNFSHLTVRYGIASARPDALHHHSLIHNHAFAGLTLVRNHAQFSSRVTLQHGDATAAEFIAQRSRQGGARYKATLDRGRVFTALLSCIQENLQEVRRTDI